jgi:hypothetical protein
LFISQNLYRQTNLTQDCRSFDEAGNVVDTISNEDLRPVVFKSVEPWRSVADVGMTTVSFMYTAVSFAPSRDISFKRVPVGITVFPYWIATSNGAVSVINCSTGLGVVEGGQGEVSGLAALAVFGSGVVEGDAGFLS